MKKIMQIKLRNFIKLHDKEMQVKKLLGVCLMLIQEQVQLLDYNEYEIQLLGLEIE